MTQAQTLILLILLATMGMFLWGRWRHDMVAAGALLACVVLGLVDPVDAFAGFGHPAVITVACVLVLSRGLQTSGAVDVLTRHLLPATAGPVLSLAALVGLGALLSGFMNNVGAMALLMPVAVQLAGRLDLPPGRVLMPLAFGTILGGMTTMIGTPPNLIVAGFRAQTGAGSFAMFDFTPIGLALAVAGVLFIVLFGWRLVPARKRAGVEEFETGAYITEVRLTEGSKAVGMTLRAVEAALDEAEAQVLGLVRNEVRMHAPQAWRRVQAGDILIVEAEVEALANVLSSLGLGLEETVASSETEDAADDDRTAVKRDQDDETTTADEIVLQELVVRPGSALSARSASELLLRTRYGLNLLAVSRQGARSMTRLRTLRIQPGDLLLMQGPEEALAEFAADYGCVPLAARELRLPDRRQAVSAAAIMLLAVAGAAFGLLPAAVAFALGVLASMAFGSVPPRTVYQAIDWPVIVLLGALLPVAGAMQATGTADLIARLLLDHLAQSEAVVGLVLILVVTMFLSDLMNNAATAAVMCPIAIGSAQSLGVSSDTFLMAVAIGASCAFLTPIGHQNNTLILGPGGFRFGDYWRLGLPLEILVVAVSLPLLLLVWPL
jgi:di/tricarboxylate transporter